MPSLALGTSKIRLCVDVHERKLGTAHVYGKYFERQKVRQSAPLHMAHFNLRLEGGGGLHVSASYRSGRGYARVHVLFLGVAHLRTFRSGPITYPRATKPVRS